MLDLGNAADADVRQALGPGFPKHPLHKIVCIGALVGSRQPEGWRMDALGAPHIGERPEAKLISDFVERIGQLRPQLISANLHWSGWDLYPVSAGSYLGFPDNHSSSAAGRYAVTSGLIVQPAPQPVASGNVTSSN